MTLDGVRTDENGETLSYYVKSEVLSYSSNNTQVTDRREVKFEHESTPRVFDVTRDATFPDDVDLSELEAFIANCEENGGAREVVTVPAGTYDTCRIEKSDNDWPEGTMWIAPVYSGHVKAKWTRADGVKFEFTVRDFSWGQQN